MAFAVIRNQLEDIKHWTHQSALTFPACLALQALVAGVKEELWHINNVFVELEQVYRRNICCTHDEESVTSISLLGLLKQVKKKVGYTTSSLLKILLDMPLSSESDLITNNNHIASNTIQDHLYSLVTSDFHTDEMRKMYKRLFIASIQPTFELLADYFSTIYDSFDPTNEFFLSATMTAGEPQKSLPLYLQSFADRMKAAHSSRTTILATVGPFSEPHFLITLIILGSLCQSYTFAAKERAQSLVSSRGNCWQSR